MSTPQKSSRWGSFLSQAVAGVEARLDNILAEEDSAKQPAARQPARTPPISSTTAPTASLPPRSTTPSRLGSDRLQERLVRAVAAKNATQKTESSPTRRSTETAQSPRSSSDIPVAAPASLTRPSLDKTDNANVNTSDPAPIAPALGDRATAELPALAAADTPTAPETEASPSSEAQGDGAAKIEEIAPETQVLGEHPDAGTTMSQSILYEQRIADLERSLEEVRTQHQDELHTHVERIDALQAKLQYLARQTSEAARNAAVGAPAGSLEKKIADKDQQIAQLMEEGQKLASTEQTHRTIIKKLRGQLAAGEKELAELRILYYKAQNEITVLRKQMSEQGDLDRENEEAQKLTKQLRRDLEALKVEAASKDNTISELKGRVQEESERATVTKIHDQAREAGQQRVKELEDTVAALEVEKGLMADRAKLQAAELQDKANRASERFHTIELELKEEVQILESKLEALRVRAEEASSGVVGDTQAKLLRQIETLQTQYSIASENWQGIEASLIAKTTVLEKERDEALRRESEMRRKAREVTSRAKRQEEELEEARNQLPSVQQDLSSYQSQFASLRKRAEEAEAALVEARSDFERQRSAWKEEKAERTEQDRRNWLEDVPTSAFRNISRPESPLLSAPQRTFSGEFLGLQSYPARLRKTSAPSSNGEPSTGDRPSSARRPSAHPPIRSPMFPTTSAQSGTSPSLPGGLEVLASPSTHPVDRDDIFENFETPASPHNVLQDMLSVSTMTAGPSVQLVERMSAVIRRLESEKVAGKEELARISSQRDEARSEIVLLMREAEAGKAARSKVEELEREVESINERYQTTLEMLGEKSELVEELRADVDDVKAMYRDLVERTIK